jgi:MFS family permease
VDRCSIYWIIIGAGMMFAFAFAAAFLVSALVPFIIAIVAANLAYSVIDIAIKSGVAFLVTPDKRGRVFSIKYTLTNLGYAIGPFLGAMFVQMSTGLPFAISSLLGVASVMLYGAFAENIQKSSIEQSSVMGFTDVLIHLLKNYKLVCFTIGGILSAIVFGQFTVYLSQYLIVTSDPDNTYRIISYLVTTNACVVIGLQYFVGSKINQNNLFPMLMLGMFFFVVGLLSFCYAQMHYVWVIGMFIFTLGEIIVVPAEYMFVDYIAPENMRGVYYGAQNLSNLGGALGPLLCGMALVSFAPHGMFYLLYLCVVLASVFYFLGSRRRG